MEKYKVLVLSDHALSPSGVGVQTRFLINGLLEKNTWTFRQLGAAIKHENYDVQKVAEDFIIKPVDGFGNEELIRNLLVTEKPDVILLFTDPRFFVWLWNMEDEIHQICPIVYWHVWDNKPFPEYNNEFYQATDLINCHSHHTYEQVKEHWPDRTNFIPHALPEEVFFEIVDRDFVKESKVGFMGKHREDDFVLLWISRNAKRKRPADLLWSWKIFLEEVEEVNGRKPATFVMHTDPFDREGPDLTKVVDMLGITENVIFSNDRVNFQQMNMLHNMSDCVINLSFAEGFGLTTLEAMQTKTPIIAPKTGGLTRQVVDHRDGSENGVALDIEFKSLVGSQDVPYIYEDYVSVETTAKAIKKIYDMSDEERKELGEKCSDYVNSEFNYQNTIDMWHETMLKTVEDFKKGKSTTKRFELIEV